MITGRLRIWLHRRRLTAFCRHMLGDASQADQIVREVTATAVAEARRGRSDPVARLYRLAYERCLATPRSPRALAPGLISLASLPTEERAILLMREVGSLSRERIARAVDMTVADVTTLLVRARVLLAEVRVGADQRIPRADWSR